MEYKIKETLVLFTLGMFGILTLLTVPLPELPGQVAQEFSEAFLRVLTLIQPTILLVLAAFSGAYLGKKVGLRTPFIESLLKNGTGEGKPILKRQLGIGAPLGLATGILIALISIWAEPILPDSLMEMQEQISPTLAARFLYGGITEEVIMRWGIMSFLVWLLWKIIKRQPTWIYGLGILLTAFLFGLGHLPVLYATAEVVTSSLVVYIVSANMLFGIVAGWLFWKYGLEAAIIAHICAHVGMLLLGG